ncbi:MAG: serine/threonine-protein kinase, partial [Myxococcales bacterium]|nr:serine/threonine-protein kinase [Myxococcales bacterium]
GRAYASLTAGGGGLPIELVLRDPQLELLDGRYRLGEVIARGGFGTVYAGEDIALGRPVAVKLVRDSPDGRVGERVYREARAAAQTLHPAVVTVYAHGSVPELGASYVAMERLHGEDLAQRLGRVHRLAVDETCRIGLEVADLLASVHRTGIVHRDIKPANIYLGHRGRRTEEVRVLDFGIAKRADCSTLTEPGEVLGSFGYMAPEQLLGEDVDARCDVYGLGAVLYECLAGRPAYPETQLPALLAAMLAGPPVDLEALRPELPSRLRSTVERALSPDPHTRFASGAELREALAAPGA